MSAVVIRGFALAMVLEISLQGCTSTSSPILIGRFMHNRMWQLIDVVFTVPGILGNQLEAKLSKEFSPYWWCDTHSDWYTVWISMQQLMPFVIDCWINKVRIV